MVQKKKLGILTGGGDVPGLNAAIKAAVENALDESWEIVGIRRGWGLERLSLITVQIPAVPYPYPSSRSCSCASNHGHYVETLSRPSTRHGLISGGDTGTDVDWPGSLSIRNRSLSVDRIKRVSRSSVFFKTSSRRKNSKKSGDRP